jgi:hypothetical protein
VIQRLISLGVVVSLCGVSVLGQSKPPSIQGVWKVTQVKTTGANAQTIANPQPGLYFFTASHYAIMIVQGDKPRPDVPLAETNNMTADQLRAAWGPFTANAGTYELAGDTLTTKAIVAKNEGVMKTGNFRTSVVKLEGKTLTITTKASDSGPAQNPTTTTLTRIE